MAAPDPGQLLTALTTEHFTLQTARAQTTSETSARASVYMYTVSSALVALGFVSQVADGVGEVFVIFALTVLPTIYLLGCATYVRLVELGAEDLRYGIAINRIRGYYQEIAGDRADLFLLSGHDDAAGVFLNMGISPAAPESGLRVLQRDCRRQRRGRRRGRDDRARCGPRRPALARHSGRRARRGRLGLLLGAGRGPHSRACGDPGVGALPVPIGRLSASALSFKSRRSSRAQRRSRLSACAAGHVSPPVSSL